MSKVQNNQAITNALDDVLSLVDTHLQNLNPNERLFLCTHLANIITAGALTGFFKGNRHVVNAAIEKLAEDITDSVQTMFKAIDAREL